jgi:hypothetical protein
LGHEFDSKCDFCGRASKFPKKIFNRLKINSNLPLGSLLFLKPGVDCGEIAAFLSRIFWSARQSSAIMARKDASTEHEQVSCIS